MNERDLKHKNAELLFHVDFCEFGKRVGINPNGDHDEMAFFYDKNQDVFIQKHKFSHTDPAIGSLDDICATTTYSRSEFSEFLNSLRDDVYQEMNKAWKATGMQQDFRDFVLNNI